jgi:hypothetical protein
MISIYLLLDYSKLYSLLSKLSFPSFLSDNLALWGLRGTVLAIPFVSDAKCD